MATSVGNTARVILFYKGDISALTLFALHASGSVCVPEALPPLSAVVEHGAQPRPKLARHPASIVREVNDALGFEASFLKAEPGFLEQVETPHGIIDIYLGRFMVLDPPHGLLRKQDCRLLTLMELRRQPPAELELLRRAYATVMES